MKPWRPYWKHLDSIQDSLLTDAGPAPFGPLSKASAWIANLPFSHIMECDGMFRNFIDYWSDEPESVPHQLISGSEIRWQMIMRVECGLALCRDVFWKRKEFDWSQPRKTVYRHLFIELWHRDAICWASRTFDPAASARYRRAAKIRSELLLLTRHVKIGAS